jgi:hypothetical protein
MVTKLLSWLNNMLPLDLLTIQSLRIMVTGVHLVFLAPYPPDLNPIEEAFSKIKAWIRRNNDIFLAETGEDLMYDM